MKYFKQLLLPVSVVLLAHLTLGAIPCVPRQYEYDSFVCVCSADYCDEAGAIPVPAAGTYDSYTSNRAELRMEYASGDIAAAAGAGPATITVDTTNQYQTILGFGGGFTDAAGQNMNSLSEPAKENLIRAYYSRDGAEYNIGRTPIGGCDYSPRAYTLDDVEGDVELIHWSLQPEDYNYKIPNIKAAMDTSDQEVLIFGSPWSPPIWMKSNRMFNETGYLLREYWQPYANYIVKWAEAYEAEGIPLWGLTPQNEPLDQETSWVINSCVWHPEEMREWIRDYLGPSLENAGYGRLVMMADDFNRYTLPYYVEPCFNDPECSKYVDGVAVHWYSDDTESPDILLQTRDLDPSKFILYSEACNGLRAPSDQAVMLGDWTRGERYIFNILEDINYYSVGWVDWNMALDPNGDPHWIGAALDAAIIVNATADEFYKQPMYFALTHVTKFFPRGSIRIDSTPSTNDIQSAAVLREDGSVAVVIMNQAEEDTGLTLSIDGTSFIDLEITAKSWTSVVVPPPA